MYGNLPHTYPPFFSPFLRRPFLIPCHFLLYHQSYPPWECDRSHSLLCCIAFARGHRKTAENLCRYSRPFNRVCPQSNSLWKMTSRLAFRCAGRGPPVTHPSTDQVKSCLTWVIAWHRTPTTHRTLSVLLHYFILKKTAAESHRILVKVYGEHALSETTCRNWLWRFKSGDFDLSDKDRGKPPKKFKDAELQALLDEDSTQTLKQLAKALRVDQGTISRRLGVVHIIRHTVYGRGGVRKLWRGVTCGEWGLLSALRHTLNVYPRNFKKFS